MHCTKQIKKVSQILILAAVLATGSLACEGPADDLSTLPPPSQLTATQVETPSPGTANPTSTATALDHTVEPTESWNYPGAEPILPCGPALTEGGTRSYFRQPGLMKWHPDDSSVLFNFDQALWEAEAGGSELRMVVDMNPIGGSHRPDTEEENLAVHGFYADFSPDGSQVVHSTCEYRVAHELEALEHRYPDKPEEEKTRNPRGRLGYELGVVRMDTLERMRLTEDNFLDNFPAWSLDGNRVAYITNYDESWGRGGSDELGFGITRLALRTVDDPESPVLFHDSIQGAIGGFAPVWSPDGRYLAVLKGAQTGLAAHVVAVRQNSLEQTSTKVGTATIPPAWSPDSTMLALVADKDI